jgi:drug/metabolite transporter (DMT)-like permease
VKHSTAARTATYAYVNPVVAVFLGWLLLDETVDARTLAASAVILSAVAMVTLGKPTPAASGRKPDPQAPANDQKH